MESGADLKNISTAALAYLGDCVVEICVRTLLVNSGLSSSRHLNKAALNFVRAGAQAEASRVIADILTEEETNVFKRGRNIGHTNVPKSATMSEYRSATGFECLFGYLKLAGSDERIDELFRAGYKAQIEALSSNLPSVDE